MTVATGEQKAALLLRSLPADVAESVLAHVEPAFAERLRARLRELEQVPLPADHLQQALREFNDLLRIAPREISQAPPPPSSLIDVYIPSQGTRVQVESAALSEPPAPAPPPPEIAEPAPNEDPLALLVELEVPILAAALRDEKLPTVVLALSSLPLAKATDVLRQLPPEVRREAALRLGRAANLNVELQRTVARAVVVKSRRLASNPESLDVDARVKKLADLLRNLEREDRKQVLETLNQTDPETGAKVSGLLYVFEDILRIESRSLQALLAEIDMKTLALALKDADEAIQTKVTDNLSSRARELLMEEMGLLSKVSPKQVREAQGQIVQVIQRLDQEDKLVMVES
jgi:flagellar motor switch protein FliG